jgi:colicin import membrane protein
MAFGAAENSNSMADQKWSRMVAVSLGFHVAAVILIMVLANTGPSIRPFRGISYEVNIVELPGGGAQKTPSPSPGAIETKAEKAVPKETKAQRIEETRKEEKPIVVAKKTVEKAAPQPEKPKVSPMEQVNKAISKIEKKVKSENSDHLNTAISRLQAKAQSGGGGVQGGGMEGGGLGAGGGPMALYQMEVEAKIKSNWSYPIAMDKQQLEAVAVLLVRQDGTITKTRLEKRSSSTLFDESVLKAIERSNPLPPFPESYRKSYDELEITFNLKDLEGL